MASKNKNKNNNEQIRNITLIILPIALVVFGWWNVLNTAKSLEDNTIKTFQEAQLEVVENAGNAARLYFNDNLPHPDTDRPNTGLMEVNAPLKAKINKIEIEVQSQLVSPIKIGNVGDAWIYSPNYVVYDQSPDFPPIYIGKSMAEIFEIQKESGAFHYEEMTQAVGAGEEGIGWYVWDPEKAKESTPRWEFLTEDAGREIAAWKPITAFEGTDDELTWVVGMSAMLPDLMTENGAYDQVQTSILQMSVVTLVVVLLFFYLFRAQAQVQELRQQVQELRVEIDHSRRAEQVSEIVESEYFQDLAKRAQELRARND